MNSISRARTSSSPPLRRPRLDLTVQYANGVNPVVEARSLKAWAGAALLSDLQLTLRMVDEAEGRWLNRSYRNRDYPTNVLTFSYSDSMPLAGDIAICVPVVRREAAEQRKPFEAHLAHMVVHGVLHLQGFEHELSIDAELMEGIETEILDKLGYADPYEQQG
jgi:probable rRNA maturation factor